MTKHKPHTVKQWGRICDDTERSGLSTFDYCKQHNISFQTLYTWRSKLRKAKLSSTNDNNHFLGVELKDSSSKPLSTSKPSDNINIFINCQI
jgi:transposase-like protein